MVTLGACAAALLVVNGAQRVRARRGASAASGYSSGTPAPETGDASDRVAGTNPGADVDNTSPMNEL